MPEMKYPALINGVGRYLLLARRSMLYSWGSKLMKDGMMKVVLNTHS